MTPDYSRAATAAMEMLVKHQISTAPVLHLPVFKRTPGCLSLSFTEMYARLGLYRDQFADYISNFLDFESYLCKTDESMIANFGSYMDGYEE